MIISSTPLPQGIAGCSLPRPNQKQRSTNSGPGPPSESAEPTFFVCVLLLGLCRSIRVGSTWCPRWLGVMPRWVLDRAVPMPRLACVICFAVFLFSEQRTRRIVSVSRPNFPYISPMALGPAAGFHTTICFAALC